jgi:hypothetical protein
MAAVRIRRRLWTTVEVPDVVGAAGRNASHSDHKRGLDGICIFDTAQIFIASPLEPLPKTETYIHELLHACHPDMRERTVGFTARVIAEALSQHGALIK